MRWHRDSITQGEVEALYEAARRAWGEDTRYPVWAHYSKHPDAGQCYVTASWLRERLGGNIGKSRGHYVWLSPGEQYILDLAPHEGGYIYEENKEYEPITATENERTRRFAKRATTIFDNLGSLLHVSLDYMGDALPAEEPQRANDIAQSQYWHDEPDWEPSQGEYRFVYGNGQLEVSPFHQHEELLQHAGLDPDHSGPMAVGHIIVTDNQATWEVESNMNVKGLDRVFRDYTKHVGWNWGGVTNIEGEPISDEFAPKKSKVLHYVYDSTDNGHLYISSSRTPSEIALRTSGLHGEARSNILHNGTITISGRRAQVSGIHEEATQSLWDYCNDQGLILYAGNDNVLKTIPDMEQFNHADPNPTQPDDHQFPEGPVDEREPSGLYKCPVCNRLFPKWDLYQKHRRQEANDDLGDEPMQDGKFPVNDMDATHPTHFTELQPQIMPVAKKEASRVDGFQDHQEGDEYFAAYYCGSPVGYARMREGKLVESRATLSNILPYLHAKVIKYSDKQPKDLLASPVPFIYDIENDNVTVGHPGQRTSDIPGRFTPGGIVEGVYEPGGKIVFRTETNMPYSLRHVVDLWYYQHPELSVTGIFKQDDSGASAKLASTDDVGGFIAALVASDPAVHTATQALQAEGGKVYAVGGAVRDAIMGKEPKDIDLMVSGIEPAMVQAILRDLPGRVDLTGKDFGVFRYRDKGKEVEIALPRKERSTGAGHRDFHVQADPKMRPEEDLFRRDFSANAMAVDLSNGKLLDPYGGARDIEQNLLRAHNPEALSEDPLRVVRALVANARHGLVPDDRTQQQMAESAKSLEHLPQERIQAELDKLFAAKDPANAIRLAHETGVLRYLLPEVDQAFGYDQNNPHHEFELGDHITNVLERMTEKTEDPDLRLAALLHDIGKPDSAWLDPERGTNHYYEKHLPDGTVLGADHESVGAEKTRALLNRLRYPNDRINRITDLVQHHMWPAFTSERGARKFLNRVGDHADDLMDLRWADQGGKSAYPNPAGRAEGLSLDTQRNLLDQVRKGKQPTNVSQLAINGRDLIQAGIPEGPQIGQVLSWLTTQVIDDPSLNTKDQLLTLAQTRATL